MNSKFYIGITLILLFMVAAIIFGSKKNPIPPAPRSASQNQLISTPTQQASQPTSTPSSTPSATSSSPTPSSVMRAQEASIALTDDGFSPQTLTIKAGTKVTWTNKSSGLGNVSSNPHPVHTDYPPLNLGNFPVNGTLSLVFDKPGTYKYHNHLDPGLQGTIIVQ